MVYALRQQCSFLSAMARVGFATYLAYPAGVAMVIVSYPIVILMYRYIFGAVYAGGRELAGYDLSAILTYVTVSWVLNTFYMTPTGRVLGARVRDGQVAMDLIKPVNLMLIYFGQSLGRTAFRAVFATLPLLALFLLLGDVRLPAAAALAPFAAAVLLAYLINFELDYMTGLIAFYFGYNAGVRWGIRLVLSLAGGLVIPLSYFPPALARLFTLLPTQYMYFKPVQIYLGKLAPGEAWLAAAQASAWVAALLLCAQLMQRGAVRRLTVSGG